MMTTPLILDSLEIKQFRTFRHLRIERLGRVNLIVGKNNVGKSCLLEALWLYARRGSPALIIELLEARDEYSRPPLSAKREIVREIENQLFLAIKHLFHGRSDLGEQSKSIQPIQIGPINSQDDTFSIAVIGYKELIDEDKSRLWQELQLEEYSLANKVMPFLSIQVGIRRVGLYSFERDIRQIWSSPELKGFHCISIPANGLETGQIGQLWDSIALTDLEEEVLVSLRIIAPEVERVNLVSSQQISGERIPVVKTTRLDKPIPLRSLGEGMNRIFGIALALVNAQGGLLLIDEVESGLHYSVQPDLWRLIFEMAHRLNVQVFATSHSWDCIKAFQKATQEDRQEQGMLISLRRKKDKEDEIVAVLFDEQELATITHEQIEVR
jgi:AAA15 family ATPase/GTPase